MKFETVVIDEIIQNTPDAVSLRFALPADHPLRHYEPGQYLTLKYNFNGEDFLRCYSFSTLPNDHMIGITVKKTPHGFISREIVDKFRPGMGVVVGEIHGKFKIPNLGSARRTHYFFSSCSGITPVYSMIRRVLEDEPMSRVVLLYSNKSRQDIIFFEQLQELEQRYEGQFSVFHTLTGNRKFLGFRMRPKTEEGWNGWIGRVDAPMIERLMQAVKDTNKNKEYYICGPASYIQKVEQVLTTSGAESGHIHKEYFTIAPAQGQGVRTNHSADYSESILKVTLRGKTQTTELKAGERILDGLIRQGFDPPYSCSSGACASCIAKVNSGKVQMDSDLALDKSEIDDGYILTCQARCTTREVEIEYP